MSKLDALRWRLALWLAPAIKTAQSKRQLQRIALECGASRTLAIKISSVYFKRLPYGH